MNIDGIQNGYVIDHIHAGRGMMVYRYLGLDKLDCSVAIIKNAKSRRILPIYRNGCNGNIRFIIAVKVYHFTEIHLIKLIT